MTTVAARTWQAPDGRHRLLLDVQRGFPSEQDADDAAVFLLEHLRTRCGDVLQRLRALADEEPLAPPVVFAPPTP